MAADTPNSRAGMITVNDFSEHGNKEDGENNG